MIVLACAFPCVLVVAGLILWVGAVRGLAVALLVGVLGVGTYSVLIGPWQRRWGATEEEIRRRLPGDELLRSDAPSTTRAITIDAAPDEVFPWLVQIGFGRGGWYSYDWIDNDGRPSAERIDPLFQGLAVDDRIEMTPGFGPVVREIEPNHHIVSGGDTDSWCLLVEPTTSGQTRLISRWRQDWPKNVGTRLWVAIVDPGAFVMEQKMLRTIRDRVERSAGPSRATRDREVADA